MALVQITDNKNVEYRAEGLAVRSNDTGDFTRRPAEGFKAIEAVPAFADEWAMLAAQMYGTRAVLTGTINASGACPIGAKSLCGAYCFAHASWSPELSPREDIVTRYREDAKRLADMGGEVGLFMSYDTEPFPGGVVDQISRRLLIAMLEQPPAALLLHSHTAGIGDPEVVRILKDVSQCTDLIAGIGFETDAETLACTRTHHHPVRDRFDAFERLANAGIKTQASLTPLLGFEDFPSFVRRFANVGAYRAMTGELRTDFEKGGTRKAMGLELGLPIPTEREAIDICSEYNFPGGVNVREIFYVTMT